MKCSIQTLIALLLLGGIGSAAFADDYAGNWRKERQEFRKEKQELAQDRRLYRQALRHERREFRAEQQARWKQFHDRRYVKPRYYRDGYRDCSYRRPVATLSIGR